MEVMCLYNNKVQSALRSSDVLIFYKCLISNIRDLKINVVFTSHTTLTTIIVDMMTQEG